MIDLLPCPRCPGRVPVHDHHLTGSPLTECVECGTEYRVRFETDHAGDGVWAVPVWRLWLEEE